jgi:hypothetical protein
MRWRSLSTVLPRSTCGGEATTRHTTWESGNVRLTGDDGTWRHPVVYCPVIEAVLAYHSWWSVRHHGVVLPVTHWQSLILVQCMCVFQWCINIPDFSFHTCSVFCDKILIWMLTKVHSLWPIVIDLAPGCLINIAPFISIIAPWGEVSEDRSLLMDFNFLTADFPSHNSTSSDKHKILRSIVLLLINAYTFITFRISKGTNVTMVTS